MSDIRAAAERARRVANGEDIAAVYPLEKNGYERWESYNEDRLELTEPYLADHPPDELLPPTAEWVTERLGEGPELPYEDVAEWHVGPVTISSNPLDPDSRFCIDPDETTIHTRRQFLALCEGLGVEVRP